MDSIHKLLTVPQKFTDNVKSWSDVIISSSTLIDGQRRFRLSFVHV